MIRRLLATTICLILCCGISHKEAEAALSAAIVWEARTTGTANAGCGFKTGASGTDRSQQDAVQTAFTDLVIGNPTTTNLTSAAFPFGAADVGNIIKITGGTGFTAGFYEVISVAANVATMDRAVGTAGSTGGTGNLGGACSSIDTVVDVVVAGNTVWVKAGTYAEIVSVGAIDGGNGTPIILEGYNVTRGDNPTGANRPLINGADVRANNMTFTDTNGWFIKHFVVRDATGAGILQNSGVGGDLVFINVRATSNTGAGFSLSRDVTLIGCESDTNSSDGITATNVKDYRFINIYAHDNTGRGVNLSSGGNSEVIGSISESNTSSGFELGGAGTKFFIYNSVAYNNTGATSDGFLQTLASALASDRIDVLNSSSSSNGRYAFNLSGGTDVTHYFDFNNYFGHTTELVGFVAGDNDTGDTNPLFTNPAGGDFTVTTGSPLINTAIRLQTYNAGITGTYMWNIGVDQDDAAAGGSGYSRGRVVNQ